MDRRIFSLDILRGLAAAMVLFLHTPYTYEGDTPIWQAAFAVKRAGWSGVDLFFVLSGLLISGLLFKELQRSNTVDLKRFWLRRGMKIWPSYYVAYGLFVGLGISIAWDRNNPEAVSRWIENIWPNALFVQNYVDCVRWPCSWSLAIEEHFYFLLPSALLLLLFWRRLHWLPAAIVITNVAILAGRCYVVRTGGGWLSTYLPTHFRADALLFGVLLGYLFAYHERTMQQFRRWWPLALAICIAAFMVPVALRLSRSPFTYSVGFTLLYLGFGALVLMAKLFPDFGSKGPLPLRVLTHPLAAMGTYSYTIYLSQAVLLQVFRIPGIAKSGLLSGSNFIKSMLFFFGSIVLGIVMSYLVERPFLVLRNKLVPSVRKPRLAEIETSDMPVILKAGEVAPETIVPRKRAA